MHKTIKTTKPMLNNTSLRAIRQRILQAGRILVVTHVRPDGDAVGSLLGLGLSLIRAGKVVQMVLSDGFAERYHQLPGAELIEATPTGIFDLIITVDCSDLQRIGPSLDGHQCPDINIDHHATNIHFARYNLVYPQAVATSEILAELLPKLDLPMDCSVATALLFGLISDTLGFRTLNMKPKVFYVAAKLMELGADLPKLYHLALLKRSYNELKYWGVGLSNLKREGRIAWTTLSQEERQAVGYPGRDDADLINIITTMDEFDVVLVFVEQPNGKVKVSWRSLSEIDVSIIATHFGGGGHVTAAGAELQCSLNEAQEKVIAITKKFINEYEQIKEAALVLGK